MGVWIETLELIKSKYPTAVTPCVGVWIETIMTHKEIENELGHTLRGCVDWNCWDAAGEIAGAWVTPCVGVWIETSSCRSATMWRYRHTLRGCVDWNWVKIYF